MRLLAMSNDPRLHLCKHNETIDDVVLSISTISRSSKEVRSRLHDVDKLKMKSFDENSQILYRLVFPRVRCLN